MANCTAGSKITCQIRCMDPAAVEAAVRRLDPMGVEWVTYTCQLSGQKEAILIVGDQLATRLANSLPAAEDAGSTKILAALYSAELCECDVATLTRIAEDDVVSQLQKFAALGVIEHRKIHGMNYYRLTSGDTRQIFQDSIEALI